MALKRVDAPKSMVVAWTLMAMVTGCNHALTTSETLERAKYLSDSNRAAEAIHLLDSLLEVEPKVAEAYYLRGLSQERAGNEDRAIADYSAAIDHNPAYGQAFNNRAVLYAQRGELENAIDDFSSLLTNSPDFVLGYKNRGLAYHDLGKLDLAQADFDHVVQVEPDASAYFLRGNLNLERKRYEDALGDFDRAIELENTNSRCWLNRAMALARIGRLTEARDSLQKASEIDTEVISSEILFAYRTLFASESFSSSISLEAVTSAIEGTDWIASTNDDSVFPFVLQRGKEQRYLFVSFLNVDGESISIPKSSHSKIANPRLNKSMLIVNDSPQNTEKWQFIEEWSPLNDQLEVESYRLRLGGDSD